MNKREIQREAHQDEQAGDQPERTYLAWFRTIMVFILAVFLLLRAGVTQHSYSVVALGGVFLLLTIVIYLYNRQFAQRSIREKSLVTAQNIRLKKWISALIAIAAGVMIIQLLSQLIG